MTTMSYSITSTSELTDKKLPKTPKLTIHTEDGDFPIMGINSLNFKYAKKGRGKGNFLTINITVPGVVDGEPSLSNENFVLPRDFSLVLKASDFWKNHGINLTRPTETTETTETTEAAPEGIVANTAVGAVTAP